VRALQWERHAGGRTGPQKAGVWEKRCPQAASEKLREQVRAREWGGQ